MNKLDETDAFERDDLHQEFGAQARRFIKARGDFIGLTLSRKELELLAIQNNTIKQVAPLQDQVALLLIDGDY